MTFFQNNLQREFNEIGYVNIPNFLDKENLQFLLHYHIEFDNMLDTGFKTSIWSSNKFYRQKTFEMLKPIYENKLYKILPNFKGIMGNYMIKEPNENSYIDIHADWSFTDESKYDAINAWIPLVDTNIENGCLRIIPFSHKFNYPYRGRNIQHQFEKLKNYIESFAKPIEVKAGDLVLFNVKSIHFSYNNLSTTRRPAVSMVMLHENAPIYHYTNFDDHNIRRIQVKDPLFFSKYNAFENIEKQDDQILIPFKREQFDKSFFKKIFHIAKHPTSLLSKWYQLHGISKKIL